MTSPVDKALVIGEFDQAIYPGGTGPTLDTAWLGAFQVLWWYEHPKPGSREAALVPSEIPERGLVHVHDLPELFRNATWREAALTAEGYLADALNLPAGEMPGAVDRMMRLPRWAGMQRNNPVGHGLRMIVSEVLRRWGDPRFEYVEEQPATQWFPGIKMHGRSEEPSIDVAAMDRESGRPRAVVSCKWSIRHDRISDPTNECTAYKSAAVQRQIMNLQYFVITNELYGQRLNKVIEQPCVDGLVLVHLDLAEALRGGATPVMRAARSPDAQTRLLDLTELVRLTYEW